MKQERTARDKLLDEGYEDVIIFENPSYDEALIGVTYNTNQAVYDYDLMIEHLVNNENMDYEEAADFISYNCSFSYRSEYPLILCRFID